MPPRQSSIAQADLARAVRAARRAGAKSVEIVTPDGTKFTFVVGENNGESGHKSTAKVAKKLERLI